MRDDHRTSTVDGARGYETMRTGGGYRADADSLPSPADLAEDRRLDAAIRDRQRAADDAARARGEWVPSAADRLVASSLHLSMAMLGTSVEDVRPVRDRVFLILPRAHVTLPPADRIAQSLNPERYEVVQRDGATWVRETDAWFADPTNLIRNP